MGIPEWEEIAIPEGFGPFRLLYNPPSETVIVELRSIGEQFSPNQLCIRQKDAPKYEPVNGLEPMVSSESPVTSLGRPMLFRDAIGGDHHAGAVGAPMAMHENLGLRISAN